MTLNKASACVGFLITITTQERAPALSNGKG